MFQICQTGEDRKAAGLIQAACLAGLLQRWVPLNGGSDTRRDMREFYRQDAIAGLHPFQQLGGYAVVIGSRCKRGRGTRYLSRRTTSGEIIDFIHWRKAKKLMRKHIAKEAA